MFITARYLQNVCEERYPKGRDRLHANHISRNAAHDPRLLFQYSLEILIPFNGATLFLLSRAGLRRFIHHPSSFSWATSLGLVLNSWITFPNGKRGVWGRKGEFPPLRCRNTRGSNFNSIHSPCQMNNYLNSLFPSLSTPLKIHRSQSSRPTWRETVTLNVLNGD